MIFTEVPIDIFEPSISLCSYEGSVTSFAHLQTVYMSKKMHILRLREKSLPWLSGHLRPTEGT